MNEQKNNNSKLNYTVHSLLTPSASTSSSSSADSAACTRNSASTSAAIHQPHQHLQQHLSAAVSSSSASRPASTMSAPCTASNCNASSTVANVKRHADVSVCLSSSSSSSCYSSEGTGVSGSNVNAVTPASVVNSGVVIMQKLSRTIPSDKINLRLILVSGKTKEFLFNPSESAGDIAQTVFDNWPQDWKREAVSKAEILRLIYQGRFLHCNVTLGALGLPLGKTTVMHLVPRDNLPEPNSQDQRQKSKGGSSRCCSTTCCIL